MKNTVKEMTIEWLELTQGHGEFDGFDEEIMDFRKLDDEDIKWYFENWYFTEEKQEQIIDEIGQEEFEEVYSDEIEEYNN
ncbi:hypothetical protein [Staphylococcus phage vB_SauM-T-SE-G1]|nr:hypothetical protein [Staphylococcus phage vB_SauM-V1SA15]